MRKDWPARTTASAVFALLAAALLPFAFRPPRYTLLNTALMIDYPWWVGASAAAATLALAATALALPWRALRLAAGVVTLVLAVLALSRAAYRLEAGPEALVAREWTGVTSLPWTEVTRVDRGPEVLLVWGQGDAQVRVDTSGFREDQRASLERTIARRVTLPPAAVGIRIPLPAGP